MPDINSSLKNFSPVHRSQMIFPTTETEKKLYSLWKEILNIEDFSITDSIIYLGASSIVLPLILKKTMDLFSVSLTLEQLINNNTVQSCARLIDSLLI